MELINFESRQLPPSTTPEAVEEEELQSTNLTKFLSRLAFILVVLGCLFFIPSSRTEAQGGNGFYIYNHNHNPVRAAVRYYDPNYCRCWVTRGWAYIQPGENRFLFNMGSQNTFFFYVYDTVDGGYWGPKDHESWVNPYGFEVNERYIQSQGESGMRSQGYVKRPFTRKYTATSGGQDYVWNLYR